MLNYSIQTPVQASRSNQPRPADIQNATGICGGCNILVGPTYLETVLSAPQEVVVRYAVGVRTGTKTVVLQVCGSCQDVYRKRGYFVLGTPSQRDARE